METVAMLSCQKLDDSVLDSAYDWLALSPLHWWLNSEQHGDSSVRTKGWTKEKLNMESDQFIRVKESFLWTDSSIFSRGGDGPNTDGPNVDPVEFKSY